ncbi:hypothetical protein [Geomesophilobacter sediminis]|uniref:Tetratricopeptide repeat protein n=1 Tax=Geomesophilobacter sediminis TaxID=2798584 RepID=A0A8J7JKW0_9BACT|nr:hypothetical protein [Geomesophilobacter sediminis]MBJ6724235.1 hypothetical protein [Geomesophilobacter sediminis]
MIRDDALPAIPIAILRPGAPRRRTPAGGFWALALGLICALLLAAPVRAAVPDNEEVSEWKQSAQKEFIAGHYEEALPFFLKIAQKRPECQSRRYAVMMLATIYSDNVVDVKKAVKWNREFLKRYADSRQKPLFQEKLDKFAELEQQQGQEEAYKEYQKIKFANKGDAYLVKRYEALIKAHPDFKLKVDVQKEIAWAYDRMNKPHESVLAFQSISAPKTGHKLSSTDQIMAEADRRYDLMKTTGKWLAWAVMALLWGAVLMMKPWRRMDRGALRSIALWTGLWVLLSASRMPSFYKMEVEGYQYVIRDTVIYLLAAANLPVLVWLVLLTRAAPWQTRPKTLRVVAPLLTLVMTIASYYLFIVHHPNGPAIVDVFGVKYEYLLGEFRERVLR